MEDSPCLVPFFLKAYIHIHDLQCPVLCALSCFIPQWVNSSPSLCCPRLGRSGGGNPLATWLTQFQSHDAQILACVRGQSALSCSRFHHGKPGTWFQIEGMDLSPFPSAQERHLSPYFSVWRLGRVDAGNCFLPSFVSGSFTTILPSSTVVSHLVS